MLVNQTELDSARGPEYRLLCGVILHLLQTTNKKSYLNKHTNNNQPALVATTGREIGRVCVCVHVRASFLDNLSQATHNPPVQVGDKLGGIVDVSGHFLVCWGEGRRHVVTVEQLVRGSVDQFHDIFVQQR